MNEHTVEVTFEKDFAEHDDPETFVEQCLDGSRCRSFARNVDAELVSVEAEAPTVECANCGEPVGLDEAKSGADRRPVHPDCFDPSQVIEDG